MNCKHCDAPLEEGAVKCPVCGMEIKETAEQVLPATEETAEEVTVETAEEVTVETAEEEQEEAPAARKPKVWLWIVTAVGGLVALALLAFAILYALDIDIFPAGNESYTMTGEASDVLADKVVATAGETELTNGELQVYYWSAVYDFLNQYSAYATTMGLDYTQPLDQQQYLDQDTTWQQFFLESALSTWHKYVALQQAAKEAGYTLTQEEQEQLDAMPENLQSMAANAGYESGKALLEKEMGALCTEEGYLQYVSTYTNALSYFDTLYDSFIPTEEEVIKYFAQNEETLKEQGITKEAGNYYDVRHILLTPEGGTADDNGQITYSEQEKAACLSRAEAMLQQWKDANGDEAAFAALATENSADTGSSANGGLYTNLTSETNFVESFKNWYLDENRQVGDTGIVESVHGYHIMYFSAAKPIWLVDTEQLLIQELAEETVGEIMERYELQVQYKKIALGEVKLG